MTAKGSGTKEDPWQLQTPPRTSEYQMWRDESADPPALVVRRERNVASFLAHVFATAPNLSRPSDISNGGPTTYSAHMLNSRCVSP